MKIAIAQMNCTVGDLAGNVARIVDFAERARARSVDLIVTPELSVCGSAATRPSKVASAALRAAAACDRAPTSTRTLTVIATRRNTTRLMRLSRLSTVNVW